MLAITLLGISRKSPITPLSIVVVIMIAMAQYGRHLSAIPAPLLTMSGPTGWRAAAIPALRSDGAAGPDELAPLTRWPPVLSHLVFWQG